MINDDVKLQVVQLYNDGRTIDDIMTETGIKSAPTIYNILDAYGVPRRPKLQGVKKMFFVIEADVYEILSGQNGTSRIVNDAVREYYERRRGKLSGK